MGRRRRSVTHRILATGLAVGLVAAWPATATAHPLGNFTINHYAGLWIDPDRIVLDLVIDHAEIPTFQARQDFDLDGDGSVSVDEIDVGRVTACQGLSSSLSLTVGDATPELRLLEAGLSFPLGVGGLSTMRQVCVFEAPLAVPIGSVPLRITFSVGSYPERLGWREIVARGSAVRLQAVDGELRTTDLSDRLRAYPADRLASPLSDKALVVDATAGGDERAPAEVPDAEPVPGAAPAPTGAASPVASPAPAATGASSPVPVEEPVIDPGGVGASELPSIFRETDLTPLVLLASLATAAALGAGHALTPGHGKTLMAAYLVGTRGSARHALGLGAAVSVSHTAGILALAAIVVAAADVLPPDVVVRWAPVVAAVSIVLIGGWMLVGEVRRRRSVSNGHGHEHGSHDGAGHDHDHARGADGGHRHDHDHGHGHGHAHGPPPGSTITWRSLFLLGLAGGLIPSTSALLILLGSIATGRPAFGFVLVVAFGLGMAAVMGGIGLLLVRARDRFDRVHAGGRVTRLREAVPLAASVIVLGFGLVLTAQALTGAYAV